MQQNEAKTFSNPSRRKEGLFGSNYTLGFLAFFWPAVGLDGP